MSDLADRGPVRLAASLDGPGGAPVLVLGNSLGTSRALWDPQLPALAGRFRLLRYEHRGHGQPGGQFSPAPPGPYTIADLGADVLALLDRYDIGEAMYCGVSLGAMVGIWLAAQASGRITSLALCCTSAYLQPADLWQRRAAAVRQGGMGAISQQVVSRWFTPAFAAACPAVPAQFAAELVGIAPEGYAGCCDAIAALDLRGQLATVRAPTLVLAGADDPATPPRHSAVIASGIPGARLRVVRGAAHLANVSNAAEVSAALMGHLAGLA
jgi:3-oxoadipate enol-lactonase